MKTLLRILALAAALMVSGPVYAHDGKDHGGGRGGGHVGGGHAFHAGHSFAARGGGHRFAHFSGHAFASRGRAGHAFGFRSGGRHNLAAGARGRTFGGRGAGIASSRSYRSRPGVAFGGTAYRGAHGTYGGGSNGGYGHGYGNGYGGSGYGGYGYGGHGYAWPWFDWTWGYPNYGFGDYPDYGYDDYGPDYGYGTATGSGPLTVDVQEDLASQGYYGGPIDGIVGPITRDAIAAYQQAHGLLVTGTIDANLLESLGLE